MTGGTSRIAGPIRPFSCSNTPAKVLKPRFPKTQTGWSGPALLEVPPVILREACNAIYLPFLQDSSLNICRYIPDSSVQFRTRYIWKRGHLFGWNVYIYLKIPCFFLSENDVVKTSNDTAEEKKKTGLDTSLQNTASILRRAGLIRSDSLSKIRESTYYYKT